jgi:phage shock protein PspC (stress-responsive transcriptional regulator)
MLALVDTPEPTSTMEPPPPPPPPQQPAPFATRRLRRRPAAGKLGGVCAGIADYLAIDVTVVRLLALLLALTGPGIPAYIVAWVVMPEAGADDAGTVPDGGAGAGDRGPQLLGIGLLILAVLVVWDGWGWPGDGFVVPIVLIGAGVTLLARSPGGTREPAAPSTSPVQRSGAAVDPDVTATTPLAAAGPTVPGPPPAPPTWFEPDEPAPVEPKRRSAASPIALGVARVWGGVAVLLGVSVETGLAVGLGVLGVGIVAGGFLGGGRALILPAVLLALGLVGTAAIDVPIRGGVGERQWDVAAAADVTGPFRLAAGEAVLDLRELRPRAEQTITIEASVALGSLLVQLPEGVPVRVDASAGAGEVTVLGDNEEGTDPEISLEERSRPGVGTIELDVEVGLGELEVVR